MPSQDYAQIFNPSLTFGLRVVNFVSPLNFHGLEITTTRKDLYNDAVKLAREFGEQGNQIEVKRNADAYASVTFQPDAEGKIRYFIGKQTDKTGEQAGFVHLTLEPGAYANLKVRSRPSWYLPYRLAKLRQGFDRVFLSKSDYQCSDLIEEIEYYNAESRLKFYQRPAMYLLFPLEPK